MARPYTPEEFAQEVYQPHQLAEGTMKLERELHKRFAALRHRAEWFRLEGDLAAYIASLQ